MLALAAFTRPQVPRILLKGNALGNNQPLSLEVGALLFFKGPNYCIGLFSLWRCFPRSLCVQHSAAERPLGARDSLWPPPYSGRSSPPRQPVTAPVSVPQAAFLGPPSAVSGLFLRGRCRHGFRGVGDLREGNRREGEQGELGKPCGNDAGLTPETGDREGSAGLGKSCAGRGAACGQRLPLRGIPAPGKNGLPPAHS